MVYIHDVLAAWFKDIDCCHLGEKDQGEST